MLLCPSSVTPVTLVKTVTPVTAVTLVKTVTPVMTVVVTTVSPLVIARGMDRSFEIVGGGLGSVKCVCVYGVHVRDVRCEMM